MPTYNREQSLDERVAELEQQVALLRRTGSRADDLPLFRTNYEGLNWDDDTVFTTTFETTFTPRAASLSLGLMFIGDVVGAVATGGAWQVVLNTAAVVASGTVPATNSYVLADLAIDLSAYVAQSDLRIDIETRRTAGATTAGRFGAGGSIGSGVRYARMI